MWALVWLVGVAAIGTIMLLADPPAWVGFAVGIYFGILPAFAAWLGRPAQELSRDVDPYSKGWSSRHGGPIPGPPVPTPQNVDIKNPWSPDSLYVAPEVEVHPDQVDTGNMPPPEGR